MSSSFIPQSHLSFCFFLFSLIESGLYHPLGIYSKISKAEEVGNVIVFHSLCDCSQVVILRKENLNEMFLVASFKSLRKRF